MATILQLNRGEAATSLNTTSTGAVTGTPYAVPSGAVSGRLLGWQVKADGSALSVNLMGSVDDVTYFVIDTQTTAAGGLKFLNTSVRFLRIDAVSRTGGTATTGQLYIQ